ncbi:MAG TPA: vWA domain-containing protein, partial [Polyangiales bacterium]
YFSNDDQCGVNATPSVPLLNNSAAQRDAIAMSLHQVTPGGGTPLVGATILAYSYMHQAALQGAIVGNQFVVLITDGAQSEMCSDPPRCSDAASCTDLLVNTEVPKASGAGVEIRSFVVGVPGSEPSRVVLSEIAKQGGTAPDGCDPQQGNCHFDMTMSQDLGAALGSALAKIAGQAITCELDVPQPDSGTLDMALVNVVYTPGGNQQPVLVRQDSSKPCDNGANGWQYSDSNRKIRLCGNLCKTVRADVAARVDVVLGCPSILQ